MRKLVLSVLDATLARLVNEGFVAADAVAAARDRVTIDPPKNPAHGDFSANVAMVLSKAAGKPPREIAQRIVDGLVDEAQAITKVEIAGPGFLNFTLSPVVVQRVARAVLLEGDAFGRKPKNSTGKRICVEFVSANPTGPVHIGHARGAFMGDAIARLLDAAGHDVTREFYINDYGKQVETLGRTVHKRYRELFGEVVTLVEGEYPAAYVIDIAQRLKTADGDRWLGVDESQWLPRCMQFAIDDNLSDIKATLLRANIQHDVFSSERALHTRGAVVDVARHYEQVGATYKAERAHGTEDKMRRDDSKASTFAAQQHGGTFLKTSEHGDEEDRIILRADGTPVYLTADLAYHKDKFDRGFDRCIDVFGADHSGHVPRIRAGVHLLGGAAGLAQKIDFVLVQIVRITRGGEEVRISKRKGTVFELDDLIEEAGADPCRFLFLMKTANAQIDFDLELVTKASKDNPVFTFQYGHARCAAILRKAEEEGKTFVGAAAVSDASLARLVLPEERALLKKMALLPDVVAHAAESLEPHKVLYYCQELISEFHGYYTKYKKTERVISDDIELTQGRLAMVAALKATLKNAFAILGIAAPDKMALQVPDDDVDGDAAVEAASH